MPSADPNDQRDARDFERSLREDVLAGRADPGLLTWFEALPKRVRRSLRLIVETAKRDKAELQRRSTDTVPDKQGGSQLLPQINPPLLDIEQNPWAEHNPWTELNPGADPCTLAHRVGPSIVPVHCVEPVPPVQPRDLSCLTGGGNAWAGIGRRKKRCRAFCAIGRAYVRHQSISSPSPAPVFAVDTPPHPYTRPATPPGLRESLYNCVGLLPIANGPATYGLNTPAAAQARQPPAVLPPFEQLVFQPGELEVYDRRVNARFVYVIARGRQAMGCQSRQLLRDAAVDVVNAGCIVPGMLGQLASVLYPDGMSDLTLGAEPHIALLYFCRGWYELMT
ncbi:hypothetical protein FRC12_024962 [Ceratobasidium sp. 428]|nr:hypothetical protein FRC12_024962 [Ceratobasidium sp. 428]